MVYEQVYEVFRTLIEKQEHVVVGIDGRCCSGKSTLAMNLQSKFNGNVFHMDDFFLPKQLKSASRLREIGGNVHYERFKEEVLDPLQRGLSVRYRPYCCVKDILLDEVHVQPKQLNVIEGVYAMHPVLQQEYDYTIFVTVDANIQLKRLMKRESKKKVRKYLDEWIPLEEQYFHALHLDSICDLVIDTTYVDGEQV
ncbi:uridine kinase [Pseudogracilibacillus auburnensis]|uniref:Uridine kinase n=1 Tax=Pseudogracilibacillus auburnensis TaxID=1494959 RepID=A0A2V3W7X7_9BACI|nr:uridine kinase [Pseudogracilibacillus auburnensis]PXW90130.1 uridine kinase [Pseudogracilibacillus auburnensis]